jgi:hypothetical protein
MKKGGKTMQTQPLDATRVPVRDIADFHLRWPEFRADIVALLARDDLTPGQRDSLSWLLRLADRVGVRDLN